MGQKVNPIGLRLGISRTWNSKWFAEKDYASLLKQDLDIQKFVKARLKHAAISKIEVERTAKKTKVNIFSARPGIIIGRKGDEVERLKNVPAISRWKLENKVIYIFFPVLIKGNSCFSR